MSDHPRVLWDNFELVMSWVALAQRRSGWRVRDILRSLEIAPATFYRVRARHGRCGGGHEARAGRPGSIYALLPEERMLVLDYALAFPNPRHRALAWEMADAGIVCASPASVYRVLKDRGLVPQWRNWTGGKRKRDWERARHPDERWLVDLTYISVLGRWWYLLYLLDEYSRYVVHWELNWRMDGSAVSLAVERALELPGRTREPELKTDNGPAFVGRDFRRYLAGRGLAHRRIRPHCPEDNAIVERGIRTLKELAGDEFGDNGAAEREIGLAVGYYNHERRHSALYYLRPIDYYRGEPAVLLEERRRRMAAARAERKAVNLALRGQSRAGWIQAVREARDSLNGKPVLSHSL